MPVVTQELLDLSQVADRAVGGEEDADELELDELVTEVWLDTLEDEVEELDPVDTEPALMEMLNAGSEALDVLLDAPIMIPLTDPAVVGVPASRPV